MSVSNISLLTVQVLHFESLHESLKEAIVVFNRKPSE